MSEDRNDDLTGPAKPIAPAERDELLRPLQSARLALCVSGGADSMALMHLVAEWAASGQKCFPQDFPYPNDAAHRRDPRPSGLPLPSWLDGIATRADLDARGGLPPVVVLTVDHGLRPEASQEAGIVAAEAAKLGLPHQTLKVDEPTPPTGIQEWARNLRHRLILELLDAEGWRLLDLGIAETGKVERIVVMAHHLDDQAETVLMRLARGSGLTGLGGMAPWASIETAKREGRRYSISADLMRPFLATPGERLRATLIAAGRRWIEDPSNHDPRYERVRVRKALGVLNELGISAAHISLSARRLRETEKSYGRLWRRWANGSIEVRAGLMAELPYDGLIQCGEDAAIGLLKQTIAAFGGMSRPAELSQIEQLYRDLMTADCPFKGGTLGGCRIDTDGSHRDGKILIYREGSGEGLESVMLNPGEAIEWDRRFMIEAAAAATDPVEVTALGAATWARLKRDVDGLDELGLKAAAIATMPAVWRDGHLIAVPYLETFFATPAAPAKASSNWKAWRGSEAAAFAATFNSTAIDASDGPD